MLTLYLIIYLLILITLATLAYRDMSEYILPDILNANLVILFLIFHIITNWEFLSIKESFLGFTLGGGFLLLIKFLADKFYNEDTLGLGDIKLITVSGLGLGFPNIFLALSLGSLIGLIHGLILSKKKHKTLSETQVPAGVGFAVAIALIFSIQIEILKLIPHL